MLRKITLYRYLYSNNINHSIVSTETGENVQKNEEGIVFLKSSSTLLVSVQLIDNNGFMVGNDG